MQDPITALKKIRLHITPAAGSLPGAVAAPAVFAFILGVASDGLCPFESDLVGRYPGDRLQLEVAAADAPTYFGHLFPSLRQALGMMSIPGTIALEAEVEAVTMAEDREIVRSLAKAIPHDCGGSCGCGCS